MLLTIAFISKCIIKRYMTTEIHSKLNIRFKKNILCTGQRSQIKILCVVCLINFIEEIEKTKIRTKLVYYKSIEKN